MKDIVKFSLISNYLDGNCAKIVNRAGVQLILNSMDRYPDDIGVIDYSGSALANILREVEGITSLSLSPSLSSFSYLYFSFIFLFVIRTSNWSSHESFTQESFL